MDSLGSLNKFTDSKDFIDFNSPAIIETLEAECNKLRYLESYPVVVRSKIRSKQSEIRILENELSADLNSQKSQLLKIKRRQELENKYLELSKLKEELSLFQKELVYANNVKNVASVRLQMYEDLLNSHREGDVVGGNNQDKL